MCVMTKDEVLALPVMVSIEQVADALGISRTHAYGLERRGELPVPSVRLGKRHLFRRVDLLNVLGIAEH